MEDKERRNIGASAGVYSRLKHYLLSVRGAQWRKANLAMFTVYIDDSGTDPNQKAAVATAAILPAARLVAFDREWRNLCEKEGFPDFHMSACVWHNEKSAFANWDETKMKKVIQRVRQIGRKYFLNIASLTVFKADYDELVVGELRELTGKYPFTWAIRNMIGLLDKWLVFHKVAEPFEYIFDWMDPQTQKEERYEVETVMAQAEHVAVQAGKEGKYKNYTFKDRKQIPALQCTDAIAWTCYQHSLLSHASIPLTPMAQTCWDDYYTHRNKTWLYAATMTKEQLAGWVEREKQEGQPDFERFRAWLEQHPKPKPKRKKRGR
ncbi:MAG TPA: DUF3800 domain-containing protein [Candidatus Sulfotelmatobacter sp.]